MTATATRDPLDDLFDRTPLPAPAKRDALDDIFDNTPLPVAFPSPQPRAMPAVNLSTPDSPLMGGSALAPAGVMPSPGLTTPPSVFGLDDRDPWSEYKGGMAQAPMRTTGLPATSRTGNMQPGNMGWMRDRSPRQDHASPDSMLRPSPTATTLILHRKMAELPDTPERPAIAAALAAEEHATRYKVDSKGVLPAYQQEATRIHGELADPAKSSLKPDDQRKMRSQQLTARVGNLAQSRVEEIINESDDATTYKLSQMDPADLKGRREIRQNEIRRRLNREGFNGNAFNLPDVFERGWVGEAETAVGRTLANISTSAVGFVGRAIAAVSHAVGAEDAARMELEHVEQLERDNAKTQQELRPSEKVDVLGRTGSARGFAVGTVEVATQIAMMIASAKGAEKLALMRGANAAQATRVAQWAGSASIGAQEAGGAAQTIYSRLLEAGYNKQDANAIATVNGAAVGIINAALEYVGPVKNYIGASKAGKKRLADLALKATKSGLTESGTEIAQEVVAMAAEYAAQFELPFDQRKVEGDVMQRLKESGLLSFGPGMVFGGAHAVSEARAAQGAEAADAQAMALARRDAAASALSQMPPLSDVAGRVGGELVQQAPGRWMPEQQPTPPPEPAPQVAPPAPPAAPEVRPEQAVAPKVEPPVEPQPVAPQPQQPTQGLVWNETLADYVNRRAPGGSHPPGLVARLTREHAAIVESQLVKNPGLVSDAVLWSHISDGGESNQIAREWERRVVAKNEADARNLAAKRERQPEPPTPPEVAPETPPTAKPVELPPEVPTPTTPTQATPPAQPALGPRAFGAKTREKKAAVQKAASPKLPPMTTLERLAAGIAGYEGISPDSIERKDANRLLDAMQTGNRTVVERIFRRHENQIGKGDVQGGPVMPKQGNPQRITIAKAARLWLDEHPPEVSTSAQATPTNSQPAKIISVRKTESLVRTRPTGPLENLYTVRYDDGRIIERARGKTRDEAVADAEKTRASQDMDASRSKSVTRDPWKATQAEYVNRSRGSGPLNAGLIEDHRTAVERAVKNGQPVPREVLADYASEPWAKDAIAKLGAGQAEPTQSTGSLVELRGDELGVPGDYKTMRKRAFEWVKENPVPNAVNMESGREWQISRKGIRHALMQAHNAETSLAVVALPELVRRARFERAKADRDNSAYVEQVEYWVSPLTVGGREFTVRLMAMRIADGSRMFSGMNILHSFRAYNKAARTSQTLAERGPVGPSNVRATSNIPAPFVEGNQEVTPNEGSLPTNRDNLARAMRLHLDEGRNPELYRNKKGDFLLTYGRDPGEGGGARYNVVYSRKTLDVSDGVFGDWKGSGPVDEGKWTRVLLSEAAAKASPATANRARNPMSEVPTAASPVTTTGTPPKTAKGKREVIAELEERAKKPADMPLPTKPQIASDQVPPLAIPKGNAGVSYPRKATVADNIKALVKGVPEFAFDPTLTVTENPRAVTKEEGAQLGKERAKLEASGWWSKDANEKQYPKGAKYRIDKIDAIPIGKIRLTFHDGYKFDFKPEVFGLDPDALKVGQTVRIDLSKFGVSPALAQSRARRIAERETQGTLPEDSIAANAESPRPAKPNVGLEAPKVGEATDAKAVLKALAPFLSKVQTRYAINNFGVSKDVLAATNGRSMFIVERKGVASELGARIPKSSEMVIVDANGKPVKDGGAFPEYKSVIPKPTEANKIGEIDAAETWKAITQAGVMTSEESKGVTVYLNKDGTLGFRGASEHGVSESNVQDKAAALGAVNPDYFANVMKAHLQLGSGKVTLHWDGREKPLVTRGANGDTAVVMPVNSDVPSALGRLDAVRKAWAKQDAKTTPIGGGGMASPVSMLGGQPAPESRPAKLPGREESPPRIQPAGIAGEAKPASEIILDLQDEFNHRVRTGGVARGTGGTYYPGSAKVAIRFANDLSLTAHEVSHSLDDLYGVLSQWDKPRVRSPYDEELAKFWWHGSARQSGPRAKLAYKRGEGLAEYLRGWILNPAQAEAMAPTFTEFMKEAIPPETWAKLKKFSDDVRTFAGSGPDLKFMLNVRYEDQQRGLWQGIKDRLGFGRAAGSEYATSLASKLGRMFVDDMAPVIAGYDAALSMRGKTRQQLSPSQNAEILIRALSGVDEAVVDQMEHGPVDYAATKKDGAWRRHKLAGNLDWLFEPFKGLSADQAQHERRMAIGLMQAERVIERSDVLDKRAVRSVLNKIDARLDKLRKAADMGQATEAMIDEIAQWEQIKRDVGNVQGKWRNKLVTLIDVLPDGHAWKSDSAKMLRQNDMRRQRLSGAGSGLYADDQLAEQAVAAFAAKGDAYKRMKQAAECYRVFADAMILKPMRDLGRITPEQYEAIKEDNQFYLNMERVVDDILTRPKPSGRKLGSVSEAVKKFEGGTRDILDPYVSMLAQASRVQREAQRNRAMDTLVEPLRSSRGMYQGDVKALSAIGYQAGADEPNTITIYHEGKPEHWKFEEGIYSALKGWGDESKYNLFWRGMMIPGRILRATTIYSPPFFIANKIRDMVNTLVYSESGVKPQDFFKSSTAEQKSDYILSGGHSGYYMAGRKAYAKTMRWAMRKLSGDPNTILTLPIAAARGYAKIMRWGESSTRMAEYRRAYAKAKTFGMSDLDAGYYAASHARDLMDFAKAGTVVRELGKFSPFMASMVRGFARQIEGIKRNPKAVLTRWALYVVLPTVAEYLWHTTRGEDDEEEYKSLPAWKRDMFWNFKVGENLWVRIPKPWEAGVAASGVARSIDLARGRKDAFEGYVGSVAKSVLPVGPETIILPGFRPPMESLVNYDIFRGKPVIPKYEAELPMELREGTKGASPLGKILSKTLFVDPRHIDHWIEGWFSHFGRMATKGSRSLSGEGGASWDITGLTYRSPATESVPVQKAFELSRQAQASGTREMQALYDLADEHRAATTAAEKDRLAREMRAVAQEIIPLMEERLEMRRQVARERRAIGSGR